MGHLILRGKLNESSRSSRRRWKKDSFNHSGLRPRAAAAPPFAPALAISYETHPKGLDTSRGGLVCTSRPSCSRLVATTKSPFLSAPRRLAFNKCLRLIHAAIPILSAAACLAGALPELPRSRSPFLIPSPLAHHHHYLLPHTNRVLPLHTTSPETMKFFSLLLLALLGVSMAFVPKAPLMQKTAVAPRGTCPCDRSRAS